MSLRALELFDVRIIHGHLCSISVFVSGSGFRWELGMPNGKSDSGEWSGDRYGAAEFAEMVAAEQLSSPSMRHRGQLRAGYDRRTGEGIVLEENGPRTSFVDCGLRFESQGKAEEYVKEVRRASRN